jgi:proline iminopeptidase
MLQLERHLVPVEGATLEVFAGGAGRPVVGRAHPAEVAPPPGESELFGEVPSFVRMYPRGVRGSSPARAPHERTMAQTIADLEAVRRWWGVDRWVFSGGSAGGFLGQLYALRHPEALAGLILHACAASLDYFEDPGRVRPLPDWHKGPDGRWVYTGEQETPLGAWKKETESFDVRAQLGALRVPTLILCGRHDGIVGPGSCTALHALIPGSDLVVLEHSGHNVGEADQAAYRAAVQRFLDERVQK